MIYLKACPKCAGDVEITSDHDGGLLHCLQCSMTINSPETARRAQLELTKKTAAA